MFEPRFKVIFLDDALLFLTHISEGAREKIFYNIDKIIIKNDPEIFKKIRDDIWEIRTFYAGLQYRILAFWDKRKPATTLVIATHGFIKKQDKIPPREIDKAFKLRTLFFENSY